MKYQLYHQKRYSTLNTLAYESKPFIIGFIGFWLLRMPDIGGSGLGKGSSLLIVIAALVIFFRRYFNRTDKKRY